MSGSGEDTTRLRPLPAPEWSDEARDALRNSFGRKVAARYLSDDGDAQPVPNVLGMLMHHPQLAGPWLVYNNVLLYRGTLDERLRELMVLRVAWRTRSEYEWVQHVNLAERYDISADEVEAIARGAAAECWTPLEAALLTATDELIDGYRISDATWARLVEEFDERQLIEVVFAVGSYTCLAMAFNSLGVELDADLGGVNAPALPDR